MEEKDCKFVTPDVTLFPPVFLAIDRFTCFFPQDRFSELLFHVSSITNVKKQEKGRFSVYFRKKHYDFMAHSDGTKLAEWVHEGSMVV